MFKIVQLQHSFYQIPHIGLYTYRTLPVSYCHRPALGLLLQLFFMTLREFRSCRHAKLESSSAKNHSLEGNAISKFGAWAVCPKSIQSHVHARKKLIRQRFLTYESLRTRVQYNDIIFQKPYCMNATIKLYNDIIFLPTNMTTSECAYQK
jgi:hypothetical protein